LHLEGIYQSIIGVNDKRKKAFGSFAWRTASQNTCHCLEMRG
jgi:hypothetical protein